MLKLEYKVCLLTGAGKGIGAETARLMAQAGAHVVVSDVCVNDLLLTFAII